jgi:hypothetical protein
VVCTWPSAAFLIPCTTIVIVLALRFERSFQTPKSAVELEIWSHVPEDYALSRNWEYRSPLSKSDGTLKNFEITSPKILCTGGFERKAVISILFIGTKLSTRLQHPSLKNISATTSLGEPSMSQL